MWAPGYKRVAAMFDYVVVVVSEELEARNLAAVSFRPGVLLTSTFVAVPESGWSGRAGNGLGTLFAIENASTVLGTDLVAEVKRGKSVLLVHTAGEGTRNVLTRTVKNKALIEVPNLTILEGVIKQFQEVAIPARIMVTWGDQFLLLEDSPEAIRECALSTHVMLFGLKAELTEEIASTYGVQIVRRENGAGCELLAFEDTRSYEMAKQLVQQWQGEVMVNMGMFALSGAAAERMLEVFSPELTTRHGQFNSDELWQAWLSPGYKAEPWLRERADRVKQELLERAPGVLIKSYPLSERTTWLDFGTNEQYYQSVMKLLGDDAVGRRLRGFLAVDLASVAAGCSISCSIYERSAIAAGEVRESVIVNTTAKHAELEDACVLNATLNRIKGKRCVVYNVVDHGELVVEDCFLVGVFHPVKGMIRLRMVMGAEKGAKAAWWHTCLPGNDYALCEVAELVRGVSDEAMEATKTRLERLAKLMIAEGDELIALVSRPFTIKPFVEPKPWGYEFWCASPRNVAELKPEDMDDLTLDDLMTLFPERLVGAPTRPKFPVIVKILKAEEDLSVQVHPDDSYAAALGDIYGKEETMHVLEACCDARIYLGFEQAMSQADLTESIHRGDLLSRLRGFRAQVGDTFHIPPGVVHALGAGTKVYEVSTASERTFRMYDYGRGRELHLADAWRVLKTTGDGLGPAHPQEPELTRADANLETYQLVQGAHFDLQRLRLRGEAEVTRETGGRLWLVTSLQGTVTLTTTAEPPADELLVAPLETVVVPACVDSFGLRGEGVLLCAILTAMPGG